MVNLRPDQFNRPLRSLHSQLIPKPNESPTASPAYVLREGLLRILPRPRRIKCATSHIPSAVGTNAHGFAGLGTHLTLDLLGNIRFGPDIKWIAPPGEGEFTEDEGAVDFLGLTSRTFGSTDAPSVRGCKVLSPEHRAGGVAT